MLLLARTGLTAPAVAGRGLSEGLGLTGCDAANGPVPRVLGGEPRPDGRLLARQDQGHPDRATLVLKFREGDANVPWSDCQELKLLASLANWLGQLNNHASRLCGTEQANFGGGHRAKAWPVGAIVSASYGVAPG
jgi:hypothetical protein